ncbi:hypothetical protein HYPSUDRAFT_41683 [Hypholoma sublateritium FD-334 SS-4]|uniref:NACHT domain-containing protein n=1 Tax=Hypholoma sublateritium (strain FD-334 SS-4) TaxID=945553 RepID=A0A0D2L4P6_HYPSF|nr:hypothetical protein HYPSUDRAFT_41683 [Hypholoma sublateritium FD-334 SS-4]
MDTAAHPNSAEPTPGTSTEHSFSTFDCALEEYLEGLPKDKKKSKFIELCRASATDATPQAINALLQRQEDRRALSGPVHRIFSRVMSALNDYTEVVGQLVSAQPLPCAIIWGALMVVVEASNRCDSLFESMQKELLSLAEYLQRITVYEDLYGDSTEMQRLFFVSYTNIIHFWHRVHKECKHTGLAMSARSLTSSALKKMNTIISEIHSVSNSITEQASLCQGQKDKQEYSEARTERKLQSEWREKQSVSNYFDLCMQIRGHLTPPDDVARPNTQRHESNLRYLQPETCQWLVEESCYTAWCSPGSGGPRLFCLSGLPGHGKSILTSFAIRELEFKGAAVAYYFCQFSQPCKDPTEILRLLGLQLFNIYFERQLPLDDDFGQLFMQSRKPQDVENLINELVSRLLSGGGVYFFIDGLDEAVLDGISPVLLFLNGLRKDWATAEVGLWVTKRRQVRVVDCFETHIQPEPRLTLELTDHTEADVVRFLRAKLQALKQRFCSQRSCGLSEKDSALFQATELYLIARAQGNFLWARLMTQDLDGENRVEDVKGLLGHILGDTPKELADIYKSRLDRFGRLGRNDERVAIKVMSLVAFARRQLRLEELQEAAAILAGYGKKKTAALDAARSIRTMPLKTFLGKFTTLVEVDGDISDPAPTDTCRLVHSSVFEFLYDNPAILDKDSKDYQLHFSPFALANACLTYLARPIFSQLLQKQSLSDATYTWVDSTGETVDKHLFSQYAAKYWVRHVVDLDKREQDQIRERVVTFLSSNNFQTCMQIQSIWVQGRFDQYYVGDKLSILHAMPKWLIRNRSSDSKRITITKYWLDYRELMHNWKILLSCRGCHDTDPDCSYLAFRGELDRIWWTSFGPDHLFSNFQSRYKSFRLAEDKNTFSECFEALSVSKEQIVIVRLKNWNHLDRSLQFVCEHWTLTDHVSAPSLKKKQHITTTEAATNWLFYVKPPSEGLTRLVARPTALSSDAQILRLGSQLFRKDKDRDYSVASGEGSPAYFEEVSGRGALVAIGGRSHILAAQLQEPHRFFERLGRDFTRLERLENRNNNKGTKPSTIYDTDESDDEWLSDASSDSSDVEMEAYESWSEGSTDDEGSISSSSSESSTTNSESENESEEDPASSISGGKSDAVGVESSSRGAPSVLSQSAFRSLGGRQDSVSEEEIWGMEVDAQLGVQTYNDDLMRTSNTREPTVLLTVLQHNDNSIPTKLFEYSCPSQFMLYDSPPAVHPQESLVVWSLGGGNLLFADVAVKTYFTRQLRPSAPHTRQISVKPQFSPCGHFLHVVTLEVRVQEGPQHHRTRPPSDLHLYMLALTYRLSSSKPTRSPPVLLHRVKVDLGKHEGPLSVSQLPFSFTWTPREIFVSRRGTYLDVFRIQLFGNLKHTGDSCPSEQTHKVSVAKKKTLLPDGAAFRDVLFVPLSDDNNGAYMVIVGGETRAKPEALLMKDLVVPGMRLDATESEISDGRKRQTLAHSVGAILQAEDVGGWIEAEGILVPEGRSMGHLDMRKEKFDPVDDCDAEPY